MLKAGTFIGYISPNPDPNVSEADAYLRTLKDPGMHLPSLVLDILLAGSVALFSL